MQVFAQNPAAAGTTRHHQPIVGGIRDQMQILAAQSQRLPGPHAGDRAEQHEESVPGRRRRIQQRLDLRERRLIRRACPSRLAPAVPHSWPVAAVELVVVSEFVQVTEDLLRQGLVGDGEPVELADRDQDAVHPSRAARAAGTPTLSEGIRGQPGGEQVQVAGGGQQVPVGGLSPRQEQRNRGGVRRTGVRRLRSAEEPHLQPARGQFVGLVFVVDDAVVAPRRRGVDSESPKAHSRRVGA